MRVRSKFLYYKLKLIKCYGQAVDFGDLLLKIMHTALIRDDIILGQVLYHH